MRVLILSQYFWPEMFRVNDLASELIARGHEVTVLTGVPNYPDGHVFPAYQEDPAAFATYEGAMVFRVPMLPRGKGGLRLIANYLSFVVGGLLRGPRMLRGREFDAIFVYQISPITSVLPALWLGYRKRTPVLLWVLDLWPETLAAIGVVKSPVLLGWIGSLVRFIYRRCDRILVQSRAFVANVERYAGDRAKIRYFPGWAESVFDARSLPVPAVEFEPYASAFKLIFAGNIGQAQDFPAIIAAADLLREIPDLRWIILGDGRAGDEARAEVARRGLQEQVVFLGRFPLERMPEFFAGSDALLVSLKDEPVWSMTIPGKVQSYLASGRPLLAMLNGEGARVIEEAGAGLTGPAGDSAKLAANVRAMMAMPREERLAMGDAGRRYAAAEFDRQMLIGRLEGWIEEVRPQNALAGMGG